MIRIGVGAGFSGDRVDPAIELASRGKLDYLVFECLAERTIALAMRNRLSDPSKGFDPLLRDRLAGVLPACRKQGTRIISNMGAANPEAAAREAAAVARKAGLKGLKVAAVVGDDVLNLLNECNFANHTSRFPSASPIAANAYLGMEPIVQALAEGADIVLTGRVADPSLFLAPMVHEFDWSMDDWERLGRGVIVGHLLECAGQVTGGYFADPGFKDVKDLANLGFPYAEVNEDGSAVISKIAGTGGAVTLAGVKEQLLYELHDPSSYIGPDVIADFSAITVQEDGPDRIVVRNGSGRTRPDQLKVSVGLEEGFIGEGQISYGGPGAASRGQLALDIVAERLKAFSDEIVEVRYDLIGINALAPASSNGPEPVEVRARVAARTSTLEAAVRVGREVEALYTNGPAGGGGVFQRTEQVIAIASALLDRTLVRSHLVWEEA